MPVPKAKVYQVDSGDVGVRLDVFVASREGQLSRSFVQKLIGDGAVKVNEGTTGLVI